MDYISHQQYQQVLKYMQTVNQQNFQQAMAAMRQHNFNLDMAVNNRFQPLAHPRSQQPHNQEDDEQIVRKYIDFVRRKNQAWSIFAIIFDIIKYILLAVLSLFTTLLPESLYSRFFGTQFEKIYARKLKNKYSHRKLAYYLAKTKNLSSNSVLLVISPNKEHPAILQFLNDQNISKKVKSNFFLTCYVAESKELAEIQGSKDSPQIIALRWNIFEELVIVGSEKDPKKVTVDLLNRWAHESRNLFKRDGNVLVKYRNYAARFHGIQYEEEEEEEVNLIQRDLQKNQIHQQNQAYKMVEEEARRNKQMEKERRKKAEEEESLRAEMQQERKIRKMSIPDEPSSGQIVRISFRCPDGSTIFRNFAADERLQLIYHWVQLNQQIQFQDEKRHFQIMYSYPPQPLSNKKDMRLSEVFESSQEKVVIREL